MIDQLERQILNLLTDDMQLPVPGVAADLIDEGILDSLVFVDLISRLEEKFGFEIDLADLEIDELRSARQIAAYVEARTKQMASEADTPATLPIATAG